MGDAIHHIADVGFQDDTAAGYAQADASFNYLLCDGHVNPCRWAGASIIIRVVLRWLPTCHSITTRRPDKTRDPGGRRGGTLGTYC